MIRLRRPRAGRPVKTLVSTVSSNVPREGATVHGGGERLWAQQVGGADLHRRRAEHECSGDAATIGDAAGGDHRHRDGVDHTRHQRHGPGLGGHVGGEEHPAMPAGLGSLGDDDIASVALEPDRFGHGRRRRHHGGTRGADSIHEFGRRQTEVEADHFRTTPFDELAGVVVEGDSRRTCGRACAVDTELVVEARERCGSTRRTRA